MKNTGVNSFYRTMILVALLLIGMVFQVSAQQQTVTGTVKDADGLEIPGASVTIKGTTRGTITDGLGNYSINVDQGETLVFSFIGYGTREVAYSGQPSLDIVLELAAEELEELVVVGYGTQKKESVTGSIASVKSDELTVAPFTSTSNALAGRLPGLVSKQETGQPGADAANISIRGFGAALVIVDGIIADLNSLDPSQIESVTILKDASAAIYGIKGGNGVILVTTKRGFEGKPVFTLNSSRTWQGITAMPKTPSAGQFAEMRRESHLNSGLPEVIAPFSEEEIAKYYAGDDPQYPSTDWYDELVRDWAPQRQHNLSVQGGADKVSYYGFLGYMNQETMWKNNGGEYTKYNLQSNVDVQILDNLSMRIDIASSMELRKYPWRPMDPGNIGVWSDFWNTEPIFPASFPDKSKISFAEGNAHVTSNRERAGYNDADAYNIRTAFTLDYDFKLISGLKAKAFFVYNQYHNTSKVFMAQTDSYKYNYELDEYQLAGHWGGEGQLQMGKSESRNITANLSLNYARTFGNEGEHDIRVLALYEALDNRGSWFGGSRTGFMSNELDYMYAGSTNGMGISGAANENGMISYVSRLNYEYRHKYLFETTMRLDASSYYAEEYRQGFFPGFLLGWRLSEEAFMQNMSFLDNIKIRATYGTSGDLGWDTGLRPYAYLNAYKINQNFTYMLDGEPQLGLYPLGLPNPSLTWLEMTTYNVGLDFSLFNHKLYGEVDGFFRIRDGLPAVRTSAFPSEFGATLPEENLNVDNTRGFELLLGSKGNRGSLNWNVSGNISWSRTKWEHFEESSYTDPDQIRLYQNTGQWFDRVPIYVSDGIFTSQDQIDALDFDQDQQGNITLRPGDIRYVDSNGDGLLDWRDTEIKEGTMPHWMSAINVNLHYKGFDFTALFQAAFGYYYLIDLLGTGKVLPQIVYEERWTEENNDPDAIIPRMGGSWANGLPSDFNYIQSGYLRLKTTSLGYHLPKGLMNRINLQDVRVFVSGVNLLTLSKLNKYDIDPEAPPGSSGRYYPQQRTITIGTTIKF